VGDAPAGTTPWSELLEGDEADLSPPAPDAEMAIVYTAGTTARPRGVALRHSALSTAGAGLSRLLGLSDDDRLMIVLPLHYAIPQISMAMALASGASIQLERTFSAPRFWAAARKGAATQVSLSGLALAELHAQRPKKADADHSLRLVLSTAAPKDLHEAFENRFGLCLVEGFGTTETGFITLNPVERGRRKLGTIGLPVPWYEVAVLDDWLRPAAPGATGEICARPRPASSGGVAQAGDWRRSGDLGVSDDEGFLSFVDRREDVLLLSGRTFSTKPIERALLRHPAVADAAVISLREGANDEILGVVVLRAPVRFEELAQFCREWLPGHPVPSCFKALDQMPKTPTGRVHKSWLRTHPEIFDHLHRVG
jgi:crotonobetaine/carnitine-CoA ligase